MPDSRPAAISAPKTYRLSIHRLPLLYELQVVAVDSGFRGSPAAPYRFHPMPVSAGGRLDRRIVSWDVVVQDLDERGDNPVALESRHQPAVHVHRRFRLLESPGKRDADIRMLRFSRPVHHAAHHRHLHGLDAGAVLFP